MLVLIILGLAQFTVSCSAKTVERLIPAGEYLPFFKSRPLADKIIDKNQIEQKIIKRDIPIRVPSFWLDVYPVTNLDFLKFIKKNSNWRKSQVSRIFADDHYLKHWKDDLHLSNEDDLSRPIVNVSWFAANAYCQSLDKELPTIDQWEYAIEDRGKNSKEINNRILSWYSLPNVVELSSVGKQKANGFGIHDLVGLIWEWTLDFNSFMISSELRNSGLKDEDLFCGAGSLSALDASDYAKFMRYSFRSSLKAEYTTSNLGFRCARAWRQKNGKD